MIVETTDPRCLDLPSPVPGRSETFRSLSDGAGSDSVRPGGLLPLAMALALHGWIFAMLMTLGMGTGMSHGVITVSLLPAGVLSGPAGGSALPEGGASTASEVLDVGKTMIPSTTPESFRPDETGKDVPVAELASSAPLPPEPVADVLERPKVAEQVPAVEKKSVPRPEPVAEKVAAEDKKSAAPPELRSPKPPALAKKPSEDSKPAGAQSSAVTSGADVSVSRSPAGGADSAAAGARSGNGPDLGLAGGERAPAGIGGPGIGGGPVSAGFGASDGPRFVRRVVPRYPEIARRRGREGRVVLKLVIGAGGELRHVEVVEGGGHGFEEAALAAVRASEYAPAVRGGRPVECAALLPIRFSLRGELTPRAMMAGHPAHRGAGPCNAKQTNLFNNCERHMCRMLCFLFAFLLIPGLAPARTVTDAMGRAVDIPDDIRRVICSGSGCLRLLTYLQAQDLAVAVDDIESRRNRFDSRPYAMANPQFKTMPIFGQFRGQDNPELILTLEPQPQVIFKTYATMGHDPVELQNKTGIPVVVLDAGNLGAKRADFYASLRLMGLIVGKEERAESLVAYFDAAIADLARRTADITESRRPSAYIGGVAYKGPHGFQSTEPTYPPFLFVQARNLAREEGGAGKDLSNTDVAKEKIVVWDPDHLFLDLSTLQMGEDAGGLHELRTDPAYATLTAVNEGRVYGVLPYNWYSQNFESILANAYFVGKVLYPDRFEDIDPKAKADEIYSFVVGKPVFEEMNRTFSGLAFVPVPVR